MSAPPSSILGKSSVESDFNMANGQPTKIFRLENKHGRLIKITYNETPQILNVDNFFHAIPADALQDASERAAAESRTLAGLGMEWIFEIAEQVGAKTLTLHDSWKNRNNTLSSEILKWQATAALNPESTNPIWKRAERVVKTNGTDTKQDYFERVRKGGFYGQFGFEYVKGNDMKLDISQYKGLNASFADLCL